MAWRDPNSRFKVIKGVRWTNDYENTPYFESPAAQREWFEDHTLSSGTLDQIIYSHLGDKTLTVRVPTTYRKARAWTYCLIHDSIVEDDDIRDPVTQATFNDRNYYYFITNAKYINNAVTELELELDVMQTFMFDYTIPSAFMERMHTTTDNVGDNIVPESLDTGEYTIRYSNNRTTRSAALVTPTHADVEDGETFLNKNLMVCIASTETANYWAEDQSFPYIGYGGSINGINPGLEICACSVNDWARIKQILDTHNKMDSVQALWLYPRDLLTMSSVSIVGGGSYGTLYRITGVNTADVKILSATLPDDFSDKRGNVTPKNNKLFTYPYTYVRVNNYNGGYGDYKYEWSHVTYQGKPQVAFGIIGDFSPSANFKLVPYHYKNYNADQTIGSKKSLDFDDTIDGAPFPQVASASDNYKMWLAGTKPSRDLAYTSQKINAGTTALSALSQLASGNVIGSASTLISGAVSAFTGISSLMAEEEEHKMVSATQVGTTASYCNYMSDGAHGFEINTMQINSTNARNIDRYFSRFGYAINGERQPKRKQRANWTYLKTVGCSIVPNDYAPSSWERSCAMGTQDIKAINSIYDKGITFWVNPDKIGMYYRTDGTGQETEEHLGYDWDNPVLPANQIKW